MDKEAEEIQELPILPSLPDMGHGTNSQAECQTVDEPPIKREKHSMDDLFEDVFITSVEKPPGVHERVQSEVSSYKAEEPIPLHSDPLPVGMVEVSQINIPNTF